MGLKIVAVRGPVGECRRGTPVRFSPPPSTVCQTLGGAEIQLNDGRRARSTAVRHLGPAGQVEGPCLALDTRPALRLEANNRSAAFGRDGQQGGGTGLCAARTSRPGNRRGCRILAALRLKCGTPNAREWRDCRVWCCTTGAFYTQSRARRWGSAETSNSISIEMHIGLICKTMFRRLF